jgi:hypothetical protein
MDIFQLSKFAYFLTGFIIATLFAIYRFYRDRTIKTWWFISFVGLSILCLVFGVISWLSDVNKPDKNNDEIINSVKEEAGGVKDKIDTSFKKLDKKLDTGFKKYEDGNERKINEKPLIDICEEPSIAKTNKIDSFSMVVRFCLINEYPAYEITSNSYHIFKDLENYKNDGEIKQPQFSETVIITKFKKIRHTLGITLNRSAWKNENYIYVKLSYKNAAFINMPPRKYLFKISITESFELMIVEANKDQYAEVKPFLIQQGFW